MHLCVCLYMGMLVQCPQEPGDAVGSFGAKVTGDCELPDGGKWILCNKYS